MTPNPDASPAGGPVLEGSREAVPAPTSQRFTGFDWVRLLVAGGAIAALVAFPIEQYERMSRDFEVYDALPLPTRAVLWPWARLVLALPAVVSLEVGLWVRDRPDLRRRWLLAAVVLGVLGLAVCVVAMCLVVIPAVTTTAITVMSAGEGKF